MINTKVRHSIRRFYCHTSPDAGTAGNSGTGDGGQQGQQSQEGQQGQQQGQQNNQQNNTNLLANMWDNTSNQQQQQQNANDINQPGQAANNQQQTTDPNAALNAHIETLGLNQGIDLASIQADLQDGKTESLQTVLSTVAANTYKAAMVDANRLVDTKINQALEEANATANGNFQSHLALSSLHEALPFTADPVISPVAENVFTQFISKGLSITDAIKQTGEFFKHTSQETCKALGNGAPSGTPGQAGFNASQSGFNNQQTTVQNQDWFDTLSGGAAPDNSGN